VNFLILGVEFVNSDKAPNKIIDNALMMHNTFKTEIDEMWIDTFNGGVYSALVKFAISITVIGILFFTLKLTKQWLENDLNYESIQSWIIAFLVCILLTNNGDFLKDVVFGLRSISNQVSQNFLNSVRVDVSLSSAIKSVSISQAVKTKITAEIKKCESYVDPLEKEKCLKAVAKEVEKMPKDPELTKNDQSWLDNFINDPLKTAYDVGSGIFQAATRNVIIGILYQMGLAIQILSELALLLTGLIAPIPVAFTLIPGNFQTIFKWIVAFFSIGMFKLYYNTIVGLTAVLMLDSNWIGDITYGLIIALMSPLLAGALAVGGGLAVMNSSTQGVKTIFRIITKIKPA